MNIDIMNLLFNTATTQERVKNSRITAAIVSKNDIVSIGSNSLKTHPFQKRYAKHEDCIHLHAEISAIIKALKKISSSTLENYDIYVARAKVLKNEFVYGLAKPCVGCQRAISEFGIRNVYFTCDDGTIDYL